MPPLQYPQPANGDKDLVFGAVIGVAKLTDCIPMNEALTLCAAKGWNPIYVEGPWCFIFEEAEMYTKPRECRGQLMFFYPPWES